MEKAEASTAKPEPAAAPGIFTFLKLGVAIPARRFGTFLKIFALNVLLGAALLLFKLRVVAPLAKALNCGGASSSAAADLPALVTVGWALLAGAAYLALHLAAWLTVKAAAVAACTGDGEQQQRRPTLRSILRGVLSGGTLARAAAALASGFVAKAACGAGALLAAVPAAFLLRHTRLVRLPALLAGAFYFHYLDAVCAMALVASLAESTRAAAAAGTMMMRPAPRAWRLMRGGTTARAALVLAAVTWAVRAAVGTASALAVGRWVRCGGDGELESDVAFLVYAVLVHVLERAVRMFSTVVLTVCYLECRKSEEVVQDKAGHVHVD